MRSLLLVSLLGSLSACATIEIPTTKKTFTSAVSITDVVRKGCGIYAERRNISSRQLPAFYATVVGLDADNASVATMYLRFMPIVVGGKSSAVAYFAGNHGLACVDIKNFAIS